MTKDSKIQTSVENSDKASHLEGVQNAGSAEVLVSEQRRRWAKLGLGAPIVMTLASRPVLAAQCLSNMMSGNLSNPDRGNCSKGWSPGGWGLPGGQIHIYSTPGSWTAIGLLYGNLTPNANPNQYDSYTGGATLANVPSALNQNGLASTKLLREILVITPDNYQLTRHLVCAYLNAKLSALPGSTFHYILTVQQVLDLASGVIAVPQGYSGLQAFLGSTWV